MAKQTLQTNFVDDILEESMSGKRRYNLIQNDDGTVSLEDVTNYSQIGSSFGAAQVNAMNNAINESADKSKIIDNLSDIAANQQSGMMAGALAVRELNNKIVTNTVLNPSGLDKYPMVLYVHKNILSDSQGIHANVEYTVDGTTNSFVMIGTRINPSRGRYLIMSRTTQDLVSTRIISEDTIGVLRVTMDGSETKYTLS